MTTVTDITVLKRTPNQAPFFSILIPTWNNLPYLKLCIDSIRRNSSLNHQIIVHVNEGVDGTADWVKEQADIDYSYSTQNVGVCYALNSCRSLAAASYILYMNDDMYACPGWDKILMDEIELIGHRNFFLSCTAIEPKAQSACSIEKSYGVSIKDFDEKRLLEEYHLLPMEDWQGATWPPNVVHKDIWDLAGGYSIEFTPGLYSDPDFSMKLWKLGIRLFKGLANSRVYHFGSVSLKRVKKNRGYYTFVAKWGITQNIFSSCFLRRGELFDGNLAEPTLSQSQKLNNRFKQFKAIFRRD